MFKKCKIITTSAEKATEGGIIKIIDDSNFGKLFVAHRDDIGNKIFDVGVDSSIFKGVYQPKHLYVISNDDRMTLGEDWVYNTNTDTIYQLKWVPKDNDILRKVIASTNKSLGLPRPSQGFINKYCEIGGFDEVMVEYNEFVPMLGLDIDTHEIRYGETFYGLKIAPDNTITTRRVKDNWTREELLEVLNQLTEYVRFDFSWDIRQSILRRKELWIQDNL